MPEQLTDETARARGEADGADLRLGTILVTGAASGLGAAVAQAIADRGGTVVALDRAPTGWAHEVTVDLSDARRTAQHVSDALDQVGSLDGLVCAAGTDACGRLEDVDADAWDRVIRVNLIGLAATVRSALPALRRSERGRIVTVASTLGLRALPDATAYCASKFGVIGFSRALAAELSGDVGVTTLIPGGMATGFFDGRDPQYQPGPDAQLADPSHIAEAVLFALTRPAGLEVRELALMPATEPSWP